MLDQTQEAFVFFTTEGFGRFKGSELVVRYYEGYFEGGKHICVYVCLRWHSPWTG